MLLNYAVFLQRLGTRTPEMLISPRAPVGTGMFALPRSSILHYLDWEVNEAYPPRAYYCFNRLTPSKKIPIENLTEASFTDGVISVANKRLVIENRSWLRANQRTFRPHITRDSPILDTDVPSVVNYNPLKTLYHYQRNISEQRHLYENTTRTLALNIFDIYQLDKEAHHFITVKVPKALPSLALVEKIVKLKPIIADRVIKDNQLRHVLELYKWLFNTHRDNSVFKVIDDELSTKVVLVLEYNGYVLAVPLALYRQLSSESSLPSRTKFSDPLKLGRYFLLSLLRFQNNVEVDVASDETQDPSQTTSDLQPNEFLKKTSGKEEHNLAALSSDDLDKLSNAVETNSLEAMLDNSDLNNADTEAIDRVFIKTLESAKNEIELTPTAATKKDELIPPPIATEEEALALLRDATRDEKLEEYIREAAEVKAITSTEIRSLRKLAEERSNLRSPYNAKETIEAATVYRKEDVELNDNHTQLPVEGVDENLSRDAVTPFTKEYVKRGLYRKDVQACVVKLESAGLIVKNYEVTVSEGAMGKHEVHALTVKPFKGKESTVYFRLPVIDEEGRFKSSGIMYLMRKQKTDIPIRKISPFKVGIASNYSKLFVTRSERKAFSTEDMVVRWIKTSFLNDTGVIKSLELGNNFNNLAKTPNTYAYLSKHFTHVELADYMLETKASLATSRLSENVRKEAEVAGLTYIGYRKKDNVPIFIDNSEALFVLEKGGGKTEIGRVEDLLGLDPAKIPQQFTCLKVLGDDIPMGCVFGFYLGLSKLIAVFKNDITYLPANKQHKVTAGEFVVKFKDYKLVVSRKNKALSLLLGGFLFFKDFIRQYEMREFDDENIYLPLLEERGFGVMHLKELETLRDLFLDPITVDVLKDFGEPTEYLPLLLRANEMLTDFHHPDINDPTYSRIRGYDRVPGMMYKALSEAVRTYRFKHSAKSKIELDPYKVWNACLQDSTVKICEEVNPIMDLKEVEGVTFSGADGLARESVPQKMREFHTGDMGLISEATVDSSDVATNIYLTPGAKLKSLRGGVDMSRQANKLSQLLSTSSQLTPFVKHDDPKRINFINVQNSHVIPAVGYQQPIIRTKYDYVMPYRVSSMFCVMAEQDGVVLSRNDVNIAIKYKDGTEKAYQLGIVYGRAEGSIHKHSQVSALETGDKFKQGSPICYNENFFEVDWVDRSRLILKYNLLANVALTMTNADYEDGSSISSAISEKLATNYVKERSFVFEFSKNIVKLLPEGTEVDPETPLFTILDENADYGNLTDNTVALLQNLTNTSPKAKLKGKVERYEVRYNGSESDMSPSLRKLVKEIDKATYARTKGTTYEITSGAVDSEYRVDGKNLLPDTLELKVYLGTKLRQSIGDKGVYSSQLKSIVSEVFPYQVHTASGFPVDAFFGYKSILNRIVLSPLFTGIINRIMVTKSKEIAKIYFGG